jgi:hypothetical protein
MAIFGSEDDQVVGSDQFSAYDWIKASCRQICRAHLRRDFEVMIDQGGNGESKGSGKDQPAARLGHGAAQFMRRLDPFSDDQLSIRNRLLIRCAVGRAALALWRQMPGPLYSNTG